MKNYFIIKSFTAFILSTNALSNTSLDEVLVTATKLKKYELSASVIYNKLMILKNCSDYF